jgi:hypothetical protein
MAELHNANSHNEKQETPSSGVDLLESTDHRPISPESANPWSTSATLPVIQDDLKSTGGDETHSPDPWSTSATLPVSPDTEQEPSPAKAEATAAPEQTKNKEFSKAEYKIAFLHFAVRTHPSVSCLKLLTLASEYFRIQHAVTKYCSGRQYLLRYVQESHCH